MEFSGAEQAYSLQWLQREWSEGRRFSFLYFWGHRPPRHGGVSQACFSQWWECRFQVGGVEYRCAEQYMMAEKARMFGDEQALQAIMQAEEPGAMKAWGRKVKNFDPQKWDECCSDIVCVGNLAKFSQNLPLRQFLAATESKVLVEASPVDSIWGIGLDKTAPEAADPMQWRGENRLGFALMQVRDLLKTKQ